MTSLRIKHLKRYKDLVGLLMKYGQLDLLKEMDSHDVSSSEKHFLLKQEIPKPTELAKDLQALGPTFIKLGQLLSTQTDLLPDAYSEALSTLQDRADPFPYSDVETMIQKEFGLKIRDIFEEFNPNPIAAASLAQVHHAVLPSNRVVAVKIQRPNIEKEILDDLNVFDEIAHFLEKKTSWAKRYDIVEKIRQLRSTLLNEIDYQKEAINLTLFKRNLRNFPNIIIPSPISDYTTSRVLTMDFIEGQKMTNISPLIRMEINGKKLAQELFEAYLKQILLDGIVHIDPHPGNVYLSQDNRIVLLDLGMVAYIGPQMQMSLLKLLLAVSEGQGEEVAEIIVRLGQKLEGFNDHEFKDQITNLVAQYQDLNWSQLPIGRLLLKIAGLGADTGLTLPATFNMLGKALLNLDLAGKIMAPDFNPNQVIRQKASELLQERMERNLSMNFLYRSLLEATEFIQHFPGRLNDFLDILSKNNLKLKLDATGENAVMKGLEKVANRITLGLILAAFIIGASQLMRVETNFTLWGYPGFAMLLFSGAALGGILLMVNILISDKKEPMDKG